MTGPLPYIGGKSRLAKQLIALFPAHHSYIEPFCGGAQVFFHKPTSRVEVLNDLDGELMNFLRICQQHHGELLRWLHYAVASRRMHDLHTRQDPSLLTDVQRAARYLYLQRTSWGGKVKGQNYNGRPTEPGKVSATVIGDAIERTAKRLDRVQLENLPYEQVLERYDRPDALFYLDPPYVDMPYYNFNFSKNDFGRLAERLAALKGKFLLSINDHPVSREAFRQFHVREVTTKYALVRNEEAHELVFANFPLPDPTPNVV